jgi:hypothetical protein
MPRNEFITPELEFMCSHRRLVAMALEKARADGDMEDITFLSQELVRTDEEVDNLITGS